MNPALENHIDPERRRRELMARVREGLASNAKRLPSKYFYDARGSRLFEKITRLPEYYQTPTERRILEGCAGSLVEDLRPEALVEYGAGSAGKTRVLLDAMRSAGRLRGYAPIDVSPEPVRRVSEEMVRSYAGLRVVGIIGDFEARIPLPFGELPRLLVFLGSTIGNLSGEEAVSFLRRAAEQMSDRDGFLVGFDLVKDPEVLERAYNDIQGVTAEFNRNMLEVLNRELGADFDPAAFRHRAFFNERDSRIEMHLVSERPQRVTFGALDLEIEFAEGESVRTELSHKYTRSSAGELFRGAGLSLERWETDDRGYFALGLGRNV